MPLAPYAAASVRTINGDTFVARNTRNQNIETVRLAGLPAPVGGQAFSSDAAYELQKLLDGSSLIISAVGHDANNHLLVFVCLSDEPFFKESSKDVIDLAETDAGVIGELALGGDAPRVEGIQNLKVFAGKGHDQ